MIQSTTPIEINKKDFTVHNRSRLAWKYFMKARDKIGTETIHFFAAAFLTQ